MLLCNTKIFPELCRTFFDKVFWYLAHMKFYQIIILLVFVLNIICKGQTLPLNTPLQEIPNGAYVKDLNNELAPYIGIYKANFGDKEIYLYISKIENNLEKSAKKSYYFDVLDIKYVVRNSSNNVLQDTQNNNLPKIGISSIGTRPYQNSIIFYYSGTNCRVGWGKIILKRISSTQLSWEYLPNDMIIDDSKCPPGTDINIYLPVTKDLIFTKQ